MKKIYIYFKDEIERNAFLLEFLAVKPGLMAGNGKGKAKRKDDWKERAKWLLNQIDVPRKTNPYYKLNNKFYRGYISPETDVSDPLSPAAIFLSGIRSLYTQSSYQNRPGAWLVVDLRNTDAGRDRMSWLETNVPRERMGENVPLPDSVRYQQNIKWVREILGAVNRYKFAGEALDYLKEIKEEQPALFEGEKVYIWEDMARLFDTMDDLNNAAYCYRTQAELMKNSSDPYLNLGYLFHSRGYIKEARDAYVKGLEINPRDEYIQYNLSLLWMENGKSQNALKNINTAILENPDRGLNYKQKGDIHLLRHEYFAAIAAYEYALGLFDDQWEEIRTECLAQLQLAYEKTGEMETAAAVSKKTKATIKEIKMSAAEMIRERLIEEVMSEDGLSREEAEALVDAFY